MAGEEDEEILEPDEVTVDEGPEDGDEKPKLDLEDSVEGSLRLKRLLSRDGDFDGGPASKKAKVDDDDAKVPPAVAAKVRMLLTKWGLMTCAVSKHVLEHMTLEELTELTNSGWMPDKYHHSKSPSELIARYYGDMRERKMIGGGGLDCIACFKFLWKLDMAGEKTLRGLPHKELRYVFEKYDGSKPIDEVIAEAGSVDEDFFDYPDNILPDNAGQATFGRFGRLELIDPVADCAVFGDANLTFSLKLAKHRKALGHVGRVIATTFEELDTLRERYHEIDDSIKILEEHFAEVYHGVDCTKIALNPQFKGLEASLGAVYYNFPHSGAIGGFFDGHPIVNWRHENLMRLFFRALRSFMKPGGIVKVSSNQGATGVRYSYIVGSALQNEFMHVETIPFLEWHLHRYGRSYGDKRDVYKRPDASNNQSYNAQAADRDMVYCFRYAPTGKTLGPQEIRMPPTLKILMQVEDGAFRGQGDRALLPDTARKNLAKQLHNRFVTEVSGTHVG